MSDNKVDKGNGNAQRPIISSDVNKTANKASDFERIRQSLAKRSMKVKFDLEGSQYKSIENIGAGAYGVVCSAVNKRNGERVAIKKTSHVFEVLTIAKRTYREIRILKHFKHDNIIKIRDILLPKEDVKSFADIYIVFDLMESDLHHIIYSQQALSEEHIRYFLYQILRGLKYIHSANVVHRDLKPSNLLVNEDCHLRIGDFGMARGITYTPDEPNYLMTQYVATRWYRAPEILLSMIEYGTAVDMWSVGCIFAEMIGRKHLFPGKDYISQVKLILGVLGTPSDAWMKNCQNDILKRIIKSLGKKPAEPWAKLFPNASRKSIDLLSKMLVLNPAERTSVDQALSHRLLNHYHDPDDEPICVPAFNFDFENKEMDMSELRTATMKEIMDFHQPKPPSLSFPALLRPAPKGNDSSSEKNHVFKKDIVFTAIDKEEPELKPVLPDSSFDSKSEQLSRSTKTSPVYVDTSKSQLDHPLSDIEMLSAKSNNGMMDITAKFDPVEDKPEVTVVAVPEKKDVKTTSDKKGGNTISEDTKALVKQALLNATQRRQREPQGGEAEKTKPVTAAQRQKEREEKRKKKKERAMEKGKKANKKATVQEKHINLSNEDLELLRRWTSMQFPTQPIKEGCGVGSPPDLSISSSNNTNTTNNSTIAIAATTNPDSTIALTMIPTSTLSNTQTNKFSKEGFAIKNSKKFRQILSKSSAPSSTQQTSTIVNATSSQAFSGGSVVLSSSHLNLSMTNFIPVLAIPSTTNPGNVEIKRIMPPPLQTTAPSSTHLTSQTPVTNQISSALSSSKTTKANLQKSIMRRASSSSVNAQSSTTTKSISVSSPPKHPSGQEHFQSLFHHHRHSTGSMQTPPKATLDTAQPAQEVDKNQYNVARDIKFDRPTENCSFNSVNDFNQFKETIQGTASSCPQQPLIGGLNSGVKQQSPDILDLLQQSPDTLNDLIGPQPKQNLLENSNPLNINTNSTSPPPPPPYPFHRSPQQIQSSSPSPNHTPSFCLPENSPQSNPSLTFSHSFGTFQANSPGNSNDSMPRPFLSKHHSEPQILRNYFHDSPNQSDINIHNSSFVGNNEDSRSSNISTPSSTPMSYFDQSMDHQQSQTLPFQNYQDQKRLPYQQLQQQQQQQNHHLQFQHHHHHHQGQQNQQQEQSHVFDSSLPFHGPQNQPTNFGMNHSRPSASASSFLFMNPNPEFSQAQQHHHHQQQQQNNQQPNLLQQQNQFSQQNQFQHQQPENHFQQQQHRHQQQNSLFHHQQEEQQQHHHQRQPFSSFNTQSEMFSNHPSQQHHNIQSSNFGANNNDSQLTSNSNYLTKPNVGISHPNFGASANPSTSGHKSKSPQLTIDTQKDSRGNDGNPQDLIAMLTKQLSKSAVVDTFPPALALTPRGTGAGYGVGMDLDAMLTDAQDNASMRVEQSPLSSSLIADWLAVSGAISQADIEALEREFVLPSPMNVSYNDVNFHQ